MDLPRPKVDFQSGFVIMTIVLIDDCTISVGCHMVTLEMVTFNFTLLHTK